MNLSVILAAFIAFSGQAQIIVDYRHVPNYKITTNIKIKERKVLTPKLDGSSL
jgi:hypothetical protein